MDPASWESLARVARARAADADPAHDFAHVTRVVRSARAIAIEEGADVDVAVTAALLHELFNHPKGHPEAHLSGEICAAEAEELLRNEGVLSAGAVADAIRTHAFSRGLVPRALEGKVLQDADRLDAIGAIGVARCFATCASMKRPFYSNEDPFCAARTPDDKAFGLDHFYVKLLRIPDTLHTRAAKRMAAERTAFLQAFVDELRREIC
jgi:uncharacterized protein